ncbi:MBL fold metallo-hydrolase [Bacillus sp. Marseille-P3661]|uniref:MBL fold metallo-hydrolase n=1 Tax=Bacillus sp. Marseille-P3661 TaxID=1936234 RepID=UPI000C8252D5|nr:MBL fold metallo-hydrolase [Bacillus sp. Marseille-P3661]
MKKRNLMAIIGFLAILFLCGCAQNPPDETNNSEIELQEEYNEQKHPDDKIVDFSVEDDKTSHHSNNPPTEQKDGNLSELKVHYINVGQADSTLLQYNDNEEQYTILLDAGNWNSNSVVSYLNSQNISQIDIAIGTHPDADHIGQLDKILNNFEVGEVWMSGNTSTSQTFQRLLTAIDTNDVDYYEPRMGDEFEVGPLKIEVLYPRNISENDNDESISLKLTYGNVRFIFTGDASKDDELKILQSGIDVQADILQLGHHGSSTSTHPSFLNEVGPSVAIYSAGQDNTYGHPHKEVVELIQGAGIKLYGTDVHGTIIVSTNGKNFVVKTQKDGTITPSSNSGTTKTMEHVDQKSGAAPSNCIDINSASIEQLQDIIHIGPARAEELINYRPYSSINGLTKIKGIGSARMEDIKSQGLACIGG